MKNQFSTSWVSSSQPRKQRKFIANAPLHIMHKFLSANLSKLLKEKYGKRNLPLRKGDEVLVMRGQFRKKKAKVVSLNLAKTRIVLEGLQHTKRDGTKVAAPLHPRAVQIQALVLEDKKRILALGRAKKSSPQNTQASLKEKLPQKNTPLPETAKLEKK